ncbi:histidine phosphatase family protein [Serratia sp. L9]|uniref:histidine phosphatase family protein n=1 Tax=Serratia sp. L9 TaxID=3423946 RepID=UPI003D679FBB
MKKKIISLVTLFLALIWIPTAVLSQTANHTPQKQAETEQAKTLRFYLVRHGQTYSNIKEMTIGGGGNAQLTPKGRYDASSLGLGLAEIEFIAGYSSTLGRAYETANQILRGRNLEVKQIEGLKDISWGDAEGRRIDDLTENFGHSGNDFAFYFGTYNDPGFKSPVNAENMFQFAARFEAALRQIAAQHPENSGNILVTAHSSMAFYLQKYRANQPLAGLANTSVSVLELKNGQFHLIDFNNTDYLKAGFAREKALPPLEITLVINPLTRLQQAGIMEGTTDSDLTAEGEKANQQLRNALKSTEFIAAYSSQLGRGYKTAQSVMANHPILVSQESQLNEIFLGHWEAEKVATIKNNQSEAARNLFSTTKLIHFVSPDEGENGEIAAYRLDSFLSSIGKKYEFSHGKVIVFTHPLIVNAFFNKRLPDQVWQPGKGIQVVTLLYKNETFRIKE